MSMGMGPKCKITSGGDRSVNEREEYSCSSYNSYNNEEKIILTCNLTEDNDSSAFYSADQYESIITAEGSGKNKNENVNENVNESVNENVNKNEMIKDDNIFKNNSTFAHYSKENILSLDGSTDNVKNICKNIMPHTEKSKKGNSQLAKGTEEKKEIKKNDKEKTIEEKKKDETENEEHEKEDKELLTNVKEEDEEEGEEEEEEEREERDENETGTEGKDEYENEDENEGDENEEKRKREELEIENERIDERKTEKRKNEKKREISGVNVQTKKCIKNGHRKCMNVSSRDGETEKTDSQCDDIRSSESQIMGNELGDNRSKRKMIASKKNENENPEKKKKKDFKCELNVHMDDDLPCKSENEIMREKNAREKNTIKKNMIKKNMIEENMKKRDIRNSVDIYEEEAEKKQKRKEGKERKEGKGETEEKNEKGEKGENEMNEQKEETDQDVLYAEEALKNYPRLFATRLPFKATQEDLEHHFSKYGKIVDVYISKKITSYGNKGFGFVSFETQEAMERALQDKLHIIRGKEIVVDIASLRDSTSDRFFVLPSNHYLLRSPRKTFYFKNKTIRNVNGSKRGYTKSFNSKSINKEQLNSFPASNINKYNNSYCNNMNNLDFIGSQKKMEVDTADTMNTASDKGYKDKMAPVTYLCHSPTKYNYSTNFTNIYGQQYHQNYMNRYDPNYYIYYNNSYDTYRNMTNNVYNGNMNTAIDDNYDVKNNAYSYYPSNFSHYDTSYMTQTTPVPTDNISYDISLNHSANVYVNTNSGYNASPVRRLPGGDEWNKRGYKLFVTKLNSITTVETIRYYFEKFGEVIDVYLPNDPCTKRPRGIAFVTFLDSECVKSILSNTSLKHIIDGKEVVVDLADPESKRKKRLNNF